MLSPRQLPRPIWSEPRWAALGIVIVVALAYAGVGRAPFVFDDWAAVVENATIRDPTNLRALLSPPENTGVTGRPFVNLTLALNHALGGLEPRGYHVFNVVAHALAALVLLGVLRRTLGRPGLAAAAAVIWAAHPLLTESVTCVVQRNEVLVGFFYLLTLYAFIRSVAPASTRPHAWQLVAVAACGLGMASKEVMVSAPLIVLLYDRTFVAGTFRDAWRRRFPLYLGLGSTWLLLAWLMAGSGQRGGTVGFGVGVAPWDYLLTQCRALVLYTKLSFWPHPLVLDYGTGVETRLAAVWPQATLLMLLATGTAWALRRASGLGFAGACWFAILAPSSSFVPLATQTISEHRFYLPLAVVTTLAVVTGHRLLGTRSRWLGAGIVAVLVGVTHPRNQDYRSELALWTDTVAQAPTNARAHNNLGLVLFHAGRRTEAQQRYAESLRLDPGYAPAYANLGDAHAAEGRIREAIASYEHALHLAPALTSVRAKLGRQHHALAVQFLKAGNVTEAVAHFEAALRLSPDEAEIHNNFGAALLAQGKWAEARSRFEHALRLRPNYAQARTSLERLQVLEARRSAPP